MNQVKVKNSYDNLYLPTRLEAVNMANSYLRERVHNGSNPKIIFEHGVHVYNVAKIAERIAMETNGILNPNVAYKLGLLHDIGRIKDETVTHVPHGIEGYNFLIDRGFSEVAPICITHNFIDKDVKKEDFPSYNDIAFNQVKEYLADIEYNDYDRLIQLADLFSRGKEIMSIQQRLDKNKAFYKVDKLSFEDKAFELRDYLNEKYNIDVEKIVADTFGLNASKNSNKQVFFVAQNDNFDLRLGFAR